MKSLLNALHEGRLIELPAADKEKSLEYLANLIEAVPDLPGVPELYEAMMARERTMNTGLGMGVACPHVRASGSGDLVCAVGWSPTGIEYGAPDGKKVHLVVMYYIPDSQKNVYLKEISSLAAAVQRGGGIQPIATAEDIATVRERLLDWVSSAIEANIPEAKARMIRLEARQAAVEAAPLPPATAALRVASVLFLQQEGQKPVVLCQQADLAAALEKDEGLATLVQQRGQFDRDGYRLVFRSATPYASGRALLEYWAVGTGATASA
jgi:mannitol/fructose-specific phosphotransferase system IIA component (Ntr-type)